MAKLGQKTAHGRFHHLLGLVGEGSQADVGQRGVIDVVKAQQGQLTRDGDMEFRGSGHDTKSHRVAGREDGGLRQILKKELTG